MSEKKQTKKVIPENLAAIDEIEAKVREKTEDPNAGFNAGTVFLGIEGRYLMLAAKYRGMKGPKNNRSFTSSYKEMCVYANFCPFTGKPLYEDI